MASLRDSLEAFKKALSPANNKLPDNIKKELYQSGIATESILNQIMDVGRVNFLIDGVNQRMDELGAECQKKMVMVQDFMGQYNSYAQGSNAAIQSGNQQLQGIARGGTMLDGDKGMLFTGFLTGALVGVLGVLAGQRTGKKK